MIMRQTEIITCKEFPITETVCAMNNSLHFMVADDHPAFRKGVAAFLREHYADCKVDEASNGDDVLKALHNSSFDVIFVDIIMPGLNGIETTKQILHLNPDAKIVALSFYEDETSIITMFESGAKAYLNKNAGREEIMKAVENVLNDSIYISNKSINDVLWKKLNNRNGIKNRPVSQREKEILLLICRGFSTREIAEQLHLSAKTVENHRNHLLEKTNTNNTASLVLYAAKKGWV
jgi:DNA-binding NarL/FixJ family response regulator